MEFDTPSRFIRDFDPQLIRVESEKGGDQRSTLPFQRPVARPQVETIRRPSVVSPQFKPVQRAVAPQQTFMRSDADIRLQGGCIIEHQRFGIGRVIRVEGSGENQKATVEFKNTGTKQLLLKFARYKVIS